MAFQKGVVYNPKGRPPGSKNKNLVQIKVQDMFEQAVASLDEFDNPIVFFADLMKDEEQDIRLRLESAKELAKYIVPKLPNDLTIHVNHHEVELSEEEIIERFQQIQAFLMKDVVSDQ